METEKEPCIVCGQPKKRGQFYCSQRCHGVSGWRIGRESWKTMKASQPSTTVDLHWAAGFFEGEASFSWTNHSLRGSQHIQVAQVNRQPLEKCQAMFGGNIVLRTKQNERHNDTHLWTVHGARARGIMMTLFLLMSKRRKQQIRKTLAGSGCVPASQAD